MNLDRRNCVHLLGRLPNLRFLSNGSIQGLDLSALPSDLSQSSRSDLAYKLAAGDQRPGAVEYVGPSEIGEPAADGAAGAPDK
jgi:hypothetical protein